MHQKRTCVTLNAKKREESLEIIYFFTSKQSIIFVIDQLHNSSSWKQIAKTKVSFDERSSERRQSSRVGIRDKRKSDSIRFDDVYVLAWRNVGATGTSVTVTNKREEVCLSCEWMGRGSFESSFKMEITSLSNCCGLLCICFYFLTCKGMKCCQRGCAVCYLYYLHHQMNAGRSLLGKGAIA